MAIRRLFGTATVDAGVFWEDKVNYKNWRIQYNSTLDNFSPLKPFRLLDPQGSLWASSDTLEEMNEALPGLIEEFSAKDALFTGNDIKKFVGLVATAATGVVVSEIGKIGDKE